MTLPLAGEHIAGWYEDPLSEFTEGSILFVGAGLLVAEDPANLFWDRANKNLGIKTSSFGAGAAGVLALGNGTAPGALADAVQLWSADFVAGDARLHVKSETGNQVIIGNGAITTDTGDLGIGTNIALGANKLKTTNLLLKELTSEYLAVRNAADTAYMKLYLADLFAVSSIALGNGSAIRTSNDDDTVVTLVARDNGVGIVTVGRLVSAADPYLEGTLGIVLAPRTQPAAPVEGWLIYNSGTDKLNVYNGTGWEVISSSGFGWQSYENPTYYYDIYEVARLGKHPAAFVKEGLAGVEALGWPLLSYAWRKSDVAVLKVESVWADGYTHALPYPFEQALADSPQIAALQARIEALERHRVKTR